MATTGFDRHPYLKTSNAPPYIERGISPMVVKKMTFAEWMRRRYGPGFLTIPQYDDMLEAWEAAQENK